MGDSPIRFTGGGSTVPNKVLATSRTEFDTKAMDFFMRERGIDVLWERAWLCTCRNPMTLAPKSTCHICHGKGVAYMQPTKERVAIQSQEKGMANMDLGLYESGTAIGTTRLESKITFRDRLSVPDVEIYQSLIFDVTDYRVKHGMFLSYDVKRIDIVFGDNGRELIEGKDYTFDEPTNMFYPKMHLVGTNVSINMAVMLRYIVIDLLKESRYQYTAFGVSSPQFENLPRKLLLKREDIFVNSEPFSLSIDTESRLKELGATQEQEQHMLDPKRQSSGGFFGGKLNG